MESSGKLAQIIQAWQKIRVFLEVESKSVLEWLALVAVCMAFLVSITTGKVTKDTLARDKDFLDSLTKMATLATGLIAGTIAYIRFFKGKLLSPKLLILPTSGVVYTGETNHHWIEVEIKNTGTVTIWNYAIEIKAKLHGNAPRLEDVTEFLHWEPNELGEIAIDIGESSYEYAFFHVHPEAAKALTFQIAVYANRGVRWTRCLTVTNPNLPPLLASSTETTKNMKPC